MNTEVTSDIAKQIDPVKLEAAIAVIKNNLRTDGTVARPTSMTQRHLHLGYSEAKALVDEMRKLGVFHD